MTLNIKDEIKDNSWEIHLKINIPHSSLIKLFLKMRGEGRNKGAMFKNIRLIAVQGDL